MNYRLIEVSAELKQSKEDNEKLDDASAELMMAGSEGKVMLLIGEAFIETDEDEANECMTFKASLLCDTPSEWGDFLKCHGDYYDFTKMSSMANRIAD